MHENIIIIIHIPQYTPNQKNYYFGHSCIADCAYKRNPKSATLVPRVHISRIQQHKHATKLEQNWNLEAFITENTHFYFVIHTNVYRHLSALQALSHFSYLHLNTLKLTKTIFTIPPTFPLFGYSSYNSLSPFFSLVYIQQHGLPNTGLLMKSTGVVDL